MALFLVVIETGEEEIDIGFFEVVGRHLDFVLMEHIPVGDPTLGAVGPDQVVDAVDALQIHGDSLKTVGNLAGNGVALQATDLLKIGELGDFHPVQPDLPAKSPGPQSG